MISIRIYGDPKPKGSTRAFVVNGRAITTTANPKTKDWQLLVSTAVQTHRPEKPYSDSVCVSLKFVFTRPKSVSVKKRPHHTVKPDLDKLIRSVMDGLSGIIYTDDAVVTGIIAMKDYGDAPGVQIDIWEGNYEADNTGQSGVR